MAELGRICLPLALIVCVYGIGVSLYGARTGRLEFSDSGRRAVYALALIPLTPSIKDLRNAKSPTATVIMSSDGVVLSELKRVNREWVPLEKVAPVVVDAPLSVGSV